MIRFWEIFIRYALSQNIVIIVNFVIHFYFQKGDIIFVLNKTTSGLCWGSSNAKTGWFKASHVEPLEHHPGGAQSKNVMLKNNTKRFKPKTVTELLQKLGLQVGFDWLCI